MTIKSRICLLYLALFSVTCVIFLFAKTYVVSVYTDDKLETAYKDIKQNPDFTVGYFQFKLSEVGLIIYPEEETNVVNSFKSEGNIDIDSYEAIKDQKLSSIEFEYQKEKRQILLTNNSVVLGKIVVSDLLLKDIVGLVGMIFLFITLFYTLVFYIIDNSFEKLVISPLKKLEKNLLSVGSVGDLQYDAGDFGNTEVGKINEVTSQILMDLNEEIDGRNRLLQAISHELKTPVANINAILDLHIKEVGKYKEKEVAHEMMLNESNKLVAEINKLVEFNSIMLRCNNTISMDIGSFIMQKLHSHPLTESVGLRFTYIRQAQFSIETVEEQINFIFDNIVYNLFKYAKKDSKVIVLSTANELKIINIKGENSEKSSSTRVGNQISAYFANKLGLEFQISSGSECYMTIIKNLKIKKG